MLTPINQAADNTNRAFLERLTGNGGAIRRHRHRQVRGLGLSRPTPTLSLKTGSKVVMLRNDPDKRWVNGTQARISRIEGRTVYVEVAGEEHELEPATWENVRYEDDRIRKMGKPRPARSASFRSASPGR